MATPKLKLLLNALRLGQPQDPQAAIFALAEELAAQDETIEELKRRLAVAQSAANILETKAARLEMEIDVLRHAGAAARRSEPPPAYAAPGSVRPEALRDAGPMSSPLGPGGIPPYQPPRIDPPPQQHAPPQGRAPGGPPPERPRSQFPPPMPPPPPPPPERPGHGGYAAPSAAGPSALAVGREANDRSYGARNNETPRMPNRRDAAMNREPPREVESSGPGGFASPQGDIGDEDSSGDFRVETVVVSRKDLDALVRPEAPFKIAPPGQAPGPDRGSIPGAPWARGPQQHAQRAAPVQDDFTMDAMYDDRDEGDDDLDDGNVTHPDLGKLNSLASALGLSPDDPRIVALKEDRPSRPRRGRDSSPGGKPPKR